MHDLTTDEGLAAALADADRLGETPAMVWVSSTPGSEEDVIAGLQDVVGSATPIVGGSAADNAIEGKWQVMAGGEAVGNGLVVFRDWLAGASLAALPDDPAARLKHLEQLYDELCRRLLETCPRLPRLKALRALAALFPGELTCITDSSRAGTLARLITGKKQVSGDMARQVAIRRRLDALLGPVAPGFDAQARRLRLPWHLYRQTQASGEEDDGARGPTARQTSRPLPAGQVTLPPNPTSSPPTRRLSRWSPGTWPRRVSSKGIVPRCSNRAASKGTGRHTSDTLQFELGAMEWRDDAYRPTERGLALLESGDPIELADWLLTHVLGPDHVLVRLRDEGPCAKPELFALLQHANPGWGTDFAPSSILNWLRTIALADLTEALARLGLPLGDGWAELIVTASKHPDRISASGLRWLVGAEAADEAVQLPDEAALTQAVAQAGHFPPALVVRMSSSTMSAKASSLLLGKGLSGSARRGWQQARRRRMISASTARHAANLQVIAVQPGWYDPSPPLGYLNPLRGDTYQRTAFLDFLIRAGEEPERPFVAVLDEMNLSHPEQYLAPLLSAMESGAALDLHQEAEPVDGVPSKLAYPPNLALIGTVNMDETTHGLSDKVLDRAFTLEADLEALQVARRGVRTAEDDARIGTGALQDQRPFLGQGARMIGAHPVHVIEQHVLGVFPIALGEQLGNGGGVQRDAVHEPGLQRREVVRL